MTRPVKLQINQKGGWRDVLRFDMATLVDQSLFLDATAEMVRSTGQTNTTMRIVTDQNPPVRLMEWNHKNCWKKVVRND